MNYKTPTQEDIVDLIRKASFLAGSVSYLANDLGVTRQSLYIIMKKKRCRITTRLMIKKYISCCELNLKTKRTKLRKRPLN